MKNDLEAVREDVFLVIERYAVVVVFISATIHTQKGTCQQRKHQFVSHGSDLCLTSFGFTFKGTYKFSILWFRMKKKSGKTWPPTGFFVFRRSRFLYLCVKRATMTRRELWDCIYDAAAGVYDRREAEGVRSVRLRRTAGYAVYRCDRRAGRSLSRPGRPARHPGRDTRLSPGPVYCRVRLFSRQEVRPSAKGC